MKRSISTAEMRNLEAVAISSGHVSGEELMERAGESLVAAILQEWPDLANGTHSAVILCGPGNNGGDGFVVARLLAARGWDVQTACTTELARLKGDAATNAARVAAQDSHLMPYNTSHLTHALSRSGKIVLIDALLGIGQSRNCDALLAPFWAAWDEIADLSPDNRLHRVSVDVPTGYNSETGEVLAQTPFEPDLIVTFHRPKPVHSMLSAEGYKVVVADIGL